MMKKSTAKIALVLCLMLLTVCLTACGSGGSDEPAGKAAAFTGEKYIYEGSEYAIKTEEMPEGYPYIANDQFTAGFKAIVDGTITTASAYSDVAKAFGDDGIKMAGIKYDGYAYYSWYSDKDYTSDTKVHVLVTFKVSGDKVTYYAYSSEGINAQDVK